MGGGGARRLLPVAQQRQDRHVKIQAVTAVATGLTCLIFYFLRRPLLKPEVDDGSAIIKKIAE
jgi:hypothetical protein